VKARATYARVDIARHSVICLLLVLRSPNDRENSYDQQQDLAITLTWVTLISASPNIYEYGESPTKEYAQTGCAFAINDTETSTKEEGRAVQRKARWIGDSNTEKR
jgi:hypothetical protein